MPFDPKTAKPFDPRTAKPKTAFDPSTAKPPQDFVPRQMVTPSQEKDTSLMGSIGRGFSNIPESAANLVGGVVGAVTSPVKTVSGLVQTATEAIDPRPMIPGVNDKPHLTALANYMVDRYGGWDNFKKTIAEDPVGLLADVSVFFSGGGAGLKATKIPEAVKAGEVMSKVGAVADPLAMPANLAKTFAKPVLVKSAEKLYQKALKPSTVLSQAERTQLVSEGLNRGIMPTQKGLDKLGKLIDDLNVQIGNKIGSSSKAGTTIDATEVLKKLDDVEELFGGTVLPEAAKAEIQAMRQEFTAAHGSQIDVAKAQSIKQKTYQVLRKSYGELKGLQVEARKQLARGIKEEIAKQVPDIAGLNAQESALLNIQDDIERAASRIANRDVVPMVPSIMGAAAEGSGGLAVAGAKWLIDSPRFKAKLAIALNKASKRGVVSRGWPAVGVAGKIQSQEQ